MDYVEYTIKFNAIVSNCNNSNWIMEIISKQNDESINALYNLSISSYLINPMDFNTLNDIDNIFDIDKIGQFKI